MRRLIALAFALAALAPAASAQYCESQQLGADDCYGGVQQVVAQQGYVQQQVVQRVVARPVYVQPQAVVVQRVVTPYVQRQVVQQFNSGYGVSQQLGAGYGIGQFNSGHVGVQQFNAGRRRGGLQLNIGGGRRQRSVQKVITRTRG